MYGIAVGIENTQQIRWQIDAGSKNTFVAGMTTYLAKALSRLTPTPYSGKDAGALPGSSGSARTQYGPHHDIAHPKTFYIGPQIDDLTRIFMSCSHGCLNAFGPIVPVINVYIGTADRRFMHFDQHIVTAHRRDLHVFQPAFSA